MSQKLQSVSVRNSSRLTRNDAQIGGSLEVGHVGDTATTDAYLKVPTLTTAQRTALTAEEGMIVYDTTAGLMYLYQGSGWGTTGGTAAGSLDAAYNGGGTITVDAADILLNLNDATSDYKFTIDNATNATIDDAFTITTLGGASSVFTDAIDVSDAGIVNAINVGANNIVGTTAVINFDSFDVDGSGNVTVGGTLDVTGASTLTGAVTMSDTVAISGAVTSQGSLLIDVDNAEAFLVRENGDVADIFTIDTTNDAADTTFVMNSKTTTGKGVYVDLDTTTGAGVHLDGQAVTSGDVLRITVNPTNMTSAGAAISVIDDGGTELFAVRDDGSVYSKSTAEGTVGFEIASGDLKVTDGDIIVSAGEVAITDNTTTSGAGLTLTSSVTTAVGFDLSAASLTTGKALDISDLAAITTGKAIHVDATGVTQTSGILVHIDSAGTGITGAGRLFLSDHTGATTTSGVLNEFKTAANDETVLVEFDAASLTTGVIVDVIGTALTTGTALDVGGLNALTTGIGINVVANSSDTGAFTLIYAKNDHASATGAVVLEVENDSTGSTFVVDHNGVTGKAIFVDAASTTQTDGVIDISVAALTTGTVIDISNLDAITTGKALHIDATGVTQTSGILVHIDSASTALTGAGRLLRVDHTGASASSAVVAEIASAAADETVVFRVTASAALAAGVLVDLSGASVTTGTILDMGGLDALTTGSALNIVSNSADTGTRDLVKIVNDNTAATGTTVLEVQQDADLAAIVVSGATTTGIDFTGLGATDRIFNATAGSGSTAAPQTNAPVGFIKIAVAGTDQWVPYYDAT